MNPEIIEEFPINIYQLKKHISKIKKRDEEPGLRLGKTEEYVNHFAVLKQTEAKDLEKELTALEVPRLKEQHIHKIIDVLPASAEEFKVLIQGETLTVNKDNIQKIIKTVKKYIKE